MTKRFNHLVLDSGPLIQGSFPSTLAESFWTIPEVISEIKDVATRERLSRLPFELKIRAPTAEALYAVKEFARVTGDLSVLSVTDLKVIALTLSLENEHNGKNTLAQTTPRLAKEHKGANSLLPQEKALKQTKNAQPGFGDNSEWITPENIEKVKSLATQIELESVNTVEEDSVSLVTIGCLTTDFAMQNVLLQMRLGLYSSEGRRIRQVKNWLLRCHACYWTSKQMERRFCDKCGNPTLIRTSYVVDAEGEIHLFLKKDFQYNNRGTIVTLPKPKSGRNGNSILLREDQKEYMQAMKGYKRHERKAGQQATDVSSIDDRLSTVFGAMNIRGPTNTTGIHDNDNGFSSTAPPTIGFGRRNPNQARRKV